MRVLECDQTRFWAKVALPNKQGCMLWMGSVNRKGYGRFWLSGRCVSAHRVSYELAYGPVPGGLVIDHVRAKGCANRHCASPEHLEAVTSAENSRRGDLNVHQKSKTHCPRGHAYDEANTYWSPGGSRVCRACQALHQRAYTERKRSA